MFACQGVPDGSQPQWRGPFVALAGAVKLMEVAGPEPTESSLGPDKLWTGFMGHYRKGTEVMDEACRLFVNRACDKVSCCKVWRFFHFRCRIMVEMVWFTIEFVSSLNKLKVRRLMSQHKFSATILILHAYEDVSKMNFKWDSTR